MDARTIQGMSDLLQVILNAQKDPKGAQALIDAAKEVYKLPEDLAKQRDDAQAIIDGASKEQQKLLDLINKNNGILSQIENKQSIYDRDKAILDTNTSIYNDNIAKLKSDQKTVADGLKDNQESLDALADLKSELDSRKESLDDRETAIGEREKKFIEASKQFAA